jgi:hypothetical protein
MHSVAGATVVVNKLIVVSSSSSGSNVRGSSSDIHIKRSSSVVTQVHLQRW